MIVAIKKIEDNINTDNLNQDEILKIKAYGSAKRRKESLNSLFLLDQLLTQEGYDNYQISKTKCGKPYVTNYDVHYNLSHSNNYLALAISKDEIGIDIEKVNNRIYKIAKRFLCGKHLKQHSEKKYSEQELIKFWTIKEAFTKMLGRGLTIPFNKIEIIDLKDYYQALYEDEVGFIKIYYHDDYIIAVSQKNQNHLKESLKIY